MASDIEYELTAPNVVEEEFDLLDIVSNSNVRRVTVFQTHRPCAGNEAEFMPTILNRFATISVPELFRRDRASVNKDLFEICFRVSIIELAQNALTNSGTGQVAHVSLVVRQKPLRFPFATPNCAKKSSAPSIHQQHASQIHVFVFAPEPGSGNPFDLNELNTAPEKANPSNSLAR